MRVGAVLFVALLAVIAVSSVNAHEERHKTLVLVDDMAQIDTNSLFFDSLKARGYELDFYRADEDEIPLVAYGEFQYDSLIYFAPRSESLGVSVEDVLGFIDQGGNVLIAGDKDASYIVRELGLSVGVELDDEGAAVIDHLNYDTAADSDGTHTTVVADNYAKDIELVLGKASFGPLLYRGAGMSLDSDNSLVFRVLSGSTTSYSFNPEDDVAEEVNTAGTATALVAALQARNNARVTISGSIDLFSNEFFNAAVASSAGVKKAVSGNKEFVTALVKWTFGERGLIRGSAVSHRRASDGESSDVYVVNEEIIYSLLIEEYDGSRWVPFKADDVQLEFVMLDPYYRRTLTHDNKGTFSTKFQAPDVYGIYTFRLEYHRKGFTSITFTDVVTVRPFRHDEYERFIVSAYPYYASALSMVAGVVAFSALFLWSR